VILLLTLYSVSVTFIAYYSVRKNMLAYDKLEAVAAQIEESLDELDVCYTNIDAKTKIEVVSDEPVVRELLQDMNRARDTILLVANKISNPLIEGDEIDE